MPNSLTVMEDPSPLVYINHNGTTGETDVYTGNPIRLEGTYNILPLRFQGSSLPSFHEIPRLITNTSLHHLKRATLILTIFTPKGISSLRMHYQKPQTSK